MIRKINVYANFDEHGVAVFDSWTDECLFFTYEFDEDLFEELVHGKNPEEASAFCHKYPDWEEIEGDIYPDNYSEFAALPDREYWLVVHIEN